MTLPAFKEILIYLLWYCLPQPPRPKLCPTGFWHWSTAGRHLHMPAWTFSHHLHEEFCSLLSSVKTARLCFLEVFLTEKTFRLVLLRGSIQAGPLGAPVTSLHCCPFSRRMNPVFHYSFQPTSPESIARVLCSVHRLPGKRYFSSLSFLAWFQEHIFLCHSSFYCYLL